MIAGIYVKGLLPSIFLYVKEMLRVGHQILWAGVERLAGKNCGMINFLIMT